MNQFSVLCSKLFTNSTVHDECDRLHRFLKSCRHRQIISSLEILEDAPKEPLITEQHRFRVAYEFADNLELIACTGVSFVREEAALKALAEAVERLLLNTSQPQNWTCWHGGPRGLPMAEIFSTNGIAFHNNALDCALKSVFELVERHAIAGHWYTKLPPLARIEGNLPNYIKITRNKLAEIGARFEVFLLNRVGNISVVLCLATSVKPDFGFHFLCGTGADFSMARALDRAFAEFSTDFLWKPLTKVTRAYADSSSVVDIIDHMLFFQTPDRISCFDFFFLDSLPAIHLERPFLNTASLSHALFTFVKSYSVKYWKRECATALPGFWLLKAASEQLLEIGFGERHAKMDLALLRKFGDDVVLNIPHPIA